MSSGVTCVALLLLGMHNPSPAALVNGTFSGSVYNAWGSTQGLDLVILNGQTMIGSFSFDSSTLTSCCTDGATYNAALVYSPTIPVQISQTVSYQSSPIAFSFTGDSFSEVYVGRNYTPDPFDNWLYLQASQIDSKATYIFLRNSVGVNYLSNVRDLGSFGFSDVSPDSFGVTTFGDSNYTPSTGGFSFAITSSSGSGFEL